MGVKNNNRFNSKNVNMFMKMLTSSLVRRRSRLLVALLAIAIGATVLLGMVTLYYDIPLQMSREFRSYGANMVLVAGEAGNISMDELDDIKKLLPEGNVVGVNPYLYESTSVNEIPATLVGTDFSQVTLTNPFWHLTGELPSDRGNVVMGSDVAEYMGLKVGDVVTFRDDNLTISAIVKTGNVEDGFIYIDIFELADYLAPRDAASIASASMIELSVSGSEEELEELAASISKEHPNVTPRLVKRVTQSETTVLSKLQGLVYLVTIVVMLLTMISVATTMMAVVLERRKEIGLKKAIGAENSAVISEFLGESIILGFLGGVVGTVCGFLFAHMVSMSVFGRSISIHPHLIFITIIVSILVTVVASLVPVKMAADVEPAIVLRGE